MKFEATLAQGVPVASAACWLVVAVTLRTAARKVPRRLQACNASLLGTQRRLLHTLRL